MYIIEISINQIYEGADMTIEALDQAIAAAAEIAQQIEAQQRIIDDLRRQIEQERRRMPIVFDTVKGGHGGKQRFRIEGFQTVTMYLAHLQRQLRNVELRQDELFNRYVAAEKAARELLNRHTFELAQQVLSGV